MIAFIPYSIKMRVAFGPKPTSPPSAWHDACLYTTVALWPLRRRAMAAARPEIPAPTTEFEAMAFSV